MLAAEHLAFSFRRFMPAHSLATAAGLLPSAGGLLARTIDAGGASPIAGLLEARRMVEEEGCTAVGVGRPVMF